MDNITDIQNVNDLLNLYFEGQSSEADDRALCEYFTSGNVDSSLQAYIPIFTCIKQKKENATNENIYIHRAKKRSIVKRLSIISSAAACVIIALTLMLPHISRKFSPKSANAYAYVDGVYSDDQKVVIESALEALDYITAPIPQSTYDPLDFLDEKYQETIQNN